MSDIEKAVNSVLYPVGLPKVPEGRARKFIDRLKSQGLVIVPREPTEGMVDEGSLQGKYVRGQITNDKAVAFSIYRIMISAYEEETHD